MESAWTAARSSICRRKASVLPVPDDGSGWLRSDAMSRHDRRDRDEARLRDAFDRWLADELRAMFDHLAAMPIPRAMAETIEAAIRQQDAAAQSGLPPESAHGSMRADRAKKQEAPARKGRAGRGRKRNGPRGGNSD